MKACSVRANETKLDSGDDRPWNEIHEDGDWPNMMQVAVLSWWERRDETLDPLSTSN